VGGRLHIRRAAEQFAAVPRRERHPAAGLRPQPARHARRAHLARHVGAARLQQDLVLRVRAGPVRAPAAGRVALIHLYFFRAPLPAHHSELPIPTRQRRAGTLLQRRVGVDGRDFDVDAPLEQSLVDPAKLEPFASLFAAAPNK